MIERVVVLPDIHAPDTDFESFKSVLNFIKDYKPHRLIQVGDLGEFESVSFWLISQPLTREGKRLRNDIDAVESVSDMINDVIPKRCKKTITLGNHENRLINKLQQFPEFEGMFDLKEVLEAKGWEVIPYNVPYYIAEKLICLHGSYLGKYPTNKHLENYGTNVIFGHSHRIAHQVKPMLFKTISAYNIGTLGNLQSNFLKMLPSGWSQSFATVDIHTDSEGGELFTVHVTEIKSHKFIRNGKLYSPNMDKEKK